MIIPFGLFVFLVVTNKDTIARVFSDKALERLRINGDVLPDAARNLIIFASVFLMIVALSRPVIEKGKTTIRLKGVSILTALDISGSMRSRDVYPNRLEFSKKKLIQFLENLPGDEVSLAAFAHSSFILAPFSSDKATLIQIANGLNENYINMASTDFVSLAELAGKLLKKKKPRLLVVFTDGGDKQSIRGLQKILKRYRIILFAVLIGTKQGAPVLNKKGKPLKRKDGSFIITQINESLGDIAQKSGGDYIVASNGQEDMRELAELIHRRFGAKKRGTIVIKKRKELFYYPLILSVVMLLAGFSSLPAKHNNTEKNKMAGR